MMIFQKGLKPVWRGVKSLKNEYKWPKLDFQIPNGRQNIAFWTNAGSLLSHEIKAVNIWLVFNR